MLNSLLRRSNKRQNLLIHIKTNEYLQSVFYNNLRTTMKKKEKCTLFVWQDNFFCCFCMLQLGLVKIFDAVNCLLLVNDYNRSQKLTTSIPIHQSTILPDAGTSDFK